MQAPRAAAGILVALALWPMAAVTLCPIAALAANGDVGIWSPAANLMTGRAGHTATLLSDGRVLVTGGIDGQSNALTSCEIYDPTGNRWTKAAGMRTARIDHAAVRLASGDVLVVGGSSGGQYNQTLDTAEVYHPATDRWSTVAASMTFSRLGPTATLLPNGLVLVAGGFDSTQPPVDASLVPGSVELFAPATETWSDVPRSPAGAQAQTATLLPDGRVLLAGGLISGGASSNVDIYDSKQNVWLTQFGMRAGRWGHTATLLRDGRVLFLGGLGGSQFEPPSFLKSGEVYDPRANSATVIAEMPVARSQHTATLLRTSMVLVVGSAFASNPATDLYDPTTNRWLPAGTVIRRYGHTATLLNDGRVLIVGGHGVGAASSAMLFDPAGPGVWSRVVASLPNIASVLALLAVLAFVGFRLRSRGLRAGEESQAEAPADDWISS